MYTYGVVSATKRPGRGFTFLFTYLFLYSVLRTCNSDPQISPSLFAPRGTVYLLSAAATQKETRISQSLYATHPECT